MAAGTFSLYWNLQNSGKYTGTPKRQRIRNDLDAHGSFLDLPRLSGEGNQGYYKRLQSVLPLRAGSDHDGLVHGVTRELGLQEKIGIKISPVSSGGSWLAPSPHVEITSTQIILYSSYVSDTDNTIDRTIDIFDHGEGYLVEDVISLIQSSEYFVAELGEDMTGQEKSNGLFPGSSSTLVSREWVPANTFFALRNQDIVVGSLYFSEKEVFAKEVSTAVATNLSNADPTRSFFQSGFSGTDFDFDPTAEGLSFTWAITERVTYNGEYFVDYERGLVTVKNSARGRGTCRYLYRNFPWYVRWSPVAVYSLRDDNYRDKVFEDEAMLNNSTQQGLASSEGVEVMTQVFERSPCLWGE